MAWRAACVVWSSAPSPRTSVSVQTPSGRGRTYSPSTVSSTERAAGAPTLRRRSCSFMAGNLSRCTFGTMRYGYKASAEQFGPRELLEFAALAEEVGLGTIAISDHFQPWRHNGGHAPNALTWLGAAGERTNHALLGTSVLTPTLRYQPAIIAQAF